MVQKADVRARDLSVDGAKDARDDGAFARLRDCAAHRAGLRGRAVAELRNVVPGTRCSLSKRATSAPSGAFRITIARPNSTS